MGRPLKPSCPQGHPFTLENTRVMPNGTRRCRACEKTWRDAQAAELKATKSGHRVVHSAVDRRTDYERAREEEERDAEMRSLKGYYDSELDRI